MPTTDQTLHHLASRVGVGDHAAFRCLYAMLAPATLETVRGELPDTAHSVHVLRATFCEVWWMCAFDARKGAKRNDLTRWVMGIAGRRCAERRHALDQIAATALPTEQTAYWTSFLADHDVWTQSQLATMLAGDDNPRLLPEQRHRSP